MTDKSPSKINLMFSEIAFCYDKMNNLISFGMHKIIKKRSLNLLDIAPNSKVLDLCTGTGDIAQIISKIQPSAQITAVDNCQSMLDIARQKNPNIAFVQADCTQLPFCDNLFDYAIISFGLRNIENRPSALDEIRRVLKSDATFLHLDFARSNTAFFVSLIFDFFVKISSLFLGKLKKHYTYLIQSKNEYPKPEILCLEFERAGFKFKERKDFLFGAITALIYTK